MMKLKHIISARQFDKKTLQKIFSVTDKIKSQKFNKSALSNKIMATLFYQPSTRTRLSFESAMIRLGGSVVATENAAEFSSAIKGETLKDTIRIISLYSEFIVTLPKNRDYLYFAKKSFDAPRAQTTFTR